MPKITPKDIAYLKMALLLAKKALGRTFPNPLVGAVIVKNGKVIGKGYHHEAGLPHAEIEALKNARTSVAGATLYVSLEPCCFFGPALLRCHHRSQDSQSGVLHA
jgi:diaminohydroxyphosphoribosylaminopyrimidine deaminase / 5-amino-6-(5-phosphoribosylamino)uracil reductase